MNSFRIFNDQENESALQKPRNEKAIGLLKANVLQPSKRSVLGVVNENKLRVQQPRAAKQAQKVSKDENAQSRKPGCKPQQQKVFAIHEDIPQEKNKTIEQRTLKIAECDQKPTESIELIQNKKEPCVSTVAETKSNITITEEKKSNKIINNDENSKHSGDIEISTNISHLHIPDCEDTLEAPCKSDLDMSIDSLCGSPMSVDKTLTLRKQEYQIALDHFYNVEEYDEEIYQYIKNAEIRYRPKHGYMRKQPDITYSMRSILVDWLVEVADEYNLQAETMFLAVSYIDRFLSYMSVVRGKLQLVGTAAMFIAAKFEEIYPPDVGEFVYITDDTYTKKQVLRMEHLILKVLAFDMSSPTILRFATKYCMETKSTTTIKHLAQYLCELSLLDAENFLQFLPSEIAASATALARHTMGVEAWPESLQQLTNMSLQQLSPCLAPLTSAFANAASYPQQAVRDKYKSSKWSCVSQLSPLLPGILSTLTLSEDDSKKLTTTEPAKQSSTCPLKTPGEVK